MVETGGHFRQFGFWHPGFAYTHKPLADELNQPARDAPRGLFSTAV
jgi:hypothetical protein